jgi:uncharacterized protein YbjT (DUF2867 family)
MTTILVTGATGTVGGELVKALTARGGVTLRAAVRKSEEAVLPPGATPAFFDYGDVASMKAALDGVDALFLLTPMVEDPASLGKVAVDLAKAARVKRVVKLSAFGAELEPGIAWTRHHRAVEKHIEASGIPWTFLRPNNFMQNLFTFSAVSPDGAIYLPWGDAAVSFIDARDIAAVAATALLAEGHAGKAYTLTGPASLTLGRIAAVLSDVSRRAIRYVDAPEAATRGALLGLHWPTWLIDGMMELHALDKAGKAAVVTGDVERITGRAPIAIEQFARDYKDRFTQK